jgi:hypothetical protein
VSIRKEFMELLKSIWPPYPIAEAELNRSGTSAASVRLKMLLEVNAPFRQVDPTHSHSFPITPAGPSPPTRTFSPPSRAKPAYSRAGGLPVAPSEVSCCQALPSKIHVSL